MASRVDVIVLDTGPLGFAVHPRPPLGFAAWFHSLRANQVTVVVPEISDYELRRELLRGELYASIEELDTLCQDLVYAPITTPIMRRAAQLWADARQQGRPTAPDAALDADVILAATALELAAAGEQPLVITTNPAHLERYTSAATWQSSNLA